MFDFLFSKKTQTEKEVYNYIRAMFGVRPKHVDLYIMALTHRSLSRKNNIHANIDNERLEYLGDAVLDMIAAEYLFKRFPLLSEGALTEMRSRMVCRDQLNKISREIGLHTLVKINEHVHSKSANGDAFEAFTGALFLELGYEKTKKILLQKVFFTRVDLDTILIENTNYKSQILTWAQKRRKKVLYKLLEDPKRVRRRRNARLYKVQLFINEKMIGEGADYTIKKAEQRAAEAGLEHIAQQKQKQYQKTVKQTRDYDTIYK
jgi:ribonuclease-3